MTGADGSPTLVVGTGLLGGAVRRRLGPRWMSAQGIAWDTPAVSVRQLRALAADLARAEGWRAAWCAGAGVVGASPATMRTELDGVAAFLDGLSDGGSPGRLFMVSSAGGVYGAGGPEVLTEGSPVHPRSAYGEGKRAIEEHIGEWAASAGTAVLIGRISNLYGPGQDLSKRQGLVSHLCWNALRNEPTQIRVPLETTRDFLHADDAAARIMSWLDRQGGADAGGATIKLVVSGVPMTLARTITLVRAVTKRRMLVVHVDDGQQNEQPKHLRFRSTVLTALDEAHLARPFETGIAEVFESLRRQFAATGRG